MPSNYGRDVGLLVDMEPGYGPDMGKWEVIVQFNGDIQRLETELGVEVEDLGDGFAVITLQRNQIAMLYGYKEIEYIELPKRLVLMLNRSLRTSCISEVQNMGRYGLTGNGVLVGIIDSGIDYTHPDFRKQDGTSRILYIWDQTESGNPPHGFRHGREYDNNQLNTILNGESPSESVTMKDVIGHGTAVSGIAAGNGMASGGREKGAAPEAPLIIVKLGYRGFESFARTTEIMRALKYILDKAETLRMPVVINISYGTNDGSHDGGSLFEQYINAAAQRWKSVIVAAAGNEGAAGHHFSGEIRSYQTIEAGFVVSENVSSLYLTLWKSFIDQFTLELILPNGASTGIISPSERITTKNIYGVLIQVYYGQPTHYNENQEIYFLIRSAAVPQGYWQLIIRGANVIDGRFNIWMPTVEEVGTGISFTQPTAHATLTLPATAKNVLSVGGYNDAIDAVAQFSGRGFARNNAYMKPDLLAPAVNIVSTSPGGGYDTFTGTSMAAPFVTGASALMMQWGIVLGNDPFLYGQRVKAYLKKGARRKPMIEYPNPMWGYGVLCLKNTMDALIYG